MMQKKKAVENSLNKLTDQLKTYGLIIVEDQNESDVIARLEIKSVRLDPIGGWITDGAALLFIERKSNKEIGKVYSGDAFITPSLQKTFERLLDGTLEFWGISL